MEFMNQLTINTEKIEEIVRKLNNQIQKLKGFKKRIHVDTLEQKMNNMPQSRVCVSTNVAINNDKCRARVQFQKSSVCYQRQCKIVPKIPDGFCWLHDKIYKQLTHNDQKALIYIPGDNSFDWDTISVSDIIDTYSNQQDKTIQEIYKSFDNITTYYNSSISINQETIELLGIVSNTLPQLLMQRIELSNKLITDEHEKMQKVIRNLSNDQTVEDAKIVEAKESIIQSRIEIDKLQSACQDDINKKKEEIKQLDSKISKINSNYEQLQKEHDMLRDFNFVNLQSMKTFPNMGKNTNEQKVDLNIIDE